MSDLKTLKEILKEQSGGTRIYPMIKDGEIPNTNDKTYLDAIGIIEKRLREEAKKWIKELEGVTYTAAPYEDDETKPIVKFINHFFNLEGPEEEWERQSRKSRMKIRMVLGAKKKDDKAICRIGRELG